MAAIFRSSGTNSSEMHLSALAERSFLDLWSYSNVYRDQGIKTLGVGSELCDLLVVCGEHVIVFSDKSAALKRTGKPEIDWIRWYRRAVKKSADQLWGAERWLDMPQRLFLDAKCVTPFPIDIPGRAVRKVHLVATARGAGTACQEYFQGGSGSLMVFPPMTAELSLDLSSTMPFCVGDVDPSRSFVHVLDDSTLDLMLEELDTITDLVEYLEKKEKFIRSGRLLSAPGEEDLLGYYAIRVNAEQKHDFTAPQGSVWQSNEHIALPEGLWEQTQTNPQYVAKKQADQVSYLWDSLISTFTMHMIAGTSLRHAEDFRLLPADDSFDVKRSERGVRHMALESRFRRRMLAAQIADAIEQASPLLRSARVISADPASSLSAAYVFLQFPRELLKEFSDYQLYRQVRAKFLYGYCAVVKGRFRSLKYVVGIATEPPKHRQGRNSSEDLCLIEGVWSKTDEQVGDEISQSMEILRDGMTRRYGFSVKEFPDISPNAFVDDGTESNDEKAQ